MSIPTNIAERIVRLGETTPEIEKIVLFGSRAKGTHRYNSDIDLAVAWEVRPPASFYLDLDEQMGLYSLDVVDLPDCDNDLLVEEIRRHGIVLYAK